MLIVMVTTISWRVTVLQARFLSPHETPPCPPDSKDALLIPVAVTEGSIIRPSADRYYEKFHIPPPDSATGVINNCFINSVVIFFNTEVPPYIYFTGQFLRMVGLLWTEEMTMQPCQEGSDLHRMVPFMEVYWRSSCFACALDARKVVI
jgi:hypothetical protein